MAGMIIQNATEGNLKGVTVEIPRGKLVVCTGVSGSGKTTLLMDVLYNECQRQYLEAMSYQGIRKPKVERVCNASPAVMITQTDGNRNPRSTVGTVTNVYTDLRMVFEKLGVRECPHCGETIGAADCVEHTQRQGDAFYVTMDCCRCGRRMDKLTRTHFSFNTREGACPQCEGLGHTAAVLPERVVDETLPPEAGAVRFWEGRYSAYQADALYKAFAHYGVPVARGTPVAQYSDTQRAILDDGVQSDAVRHAFADIPPPRTVATGRFEGVLPMVHRRLAEHDGDPGWAARYVDTAVCPSCGGERLQEEARRVTVGGMRLPELSTLSLTRLLAWIGTLRASLDGDVARLVADYLLDIQTKLQRFENVGLGYLSLDRQTITLSGGELQRVRLAGVLDSDLTGMLYIMDEPTQGLHPMDTAGMVAVLLRLRDLGNTVVIIEHDPDVMRAADYIIDVGPGAGRHGGEIIATGTLPSLLDNPASVTGQYLRRAHAVTSAGRSGTGIAVSVRDARKHNLKGLDVDFPKGCLTAVTGPSGSGKSTLVFELIAGGDHGGPWGTVSGCGQFDAVVEVGQKPITRMRRSSVATYSDAYGAIRRMFAATEAASLAGLDAGHFSLNTAGGRCERCQGLGVVPSNMLFFRDIEVVCPQCGGRRFTDAVLSIRLDGLTIRDVLDLTVEEAIQRLAPDRKLARVLGLLMDVGLGYLQLGQPLTTLSGGEGQRLQLARALLDGGGKRCLYLLDEPTVGLHPLDVEHLLVLLGRMVDAGNTVIVVEHNAQVIQTCDWVIDLGPGGGELGGALMYAGPPRQDAPA